MIKRYLFIIFTLFLAFTAFGQQPPLQVAFETNETAEEGSTIDVDVRVSDFDQLVGTQFIVGWDSLVLEIDTLPFISMDLAELNANAFSLPSQTANMTKGQLRLLWFNFSPQTLPDDHLLFTMRFNVVGQACDSTDVGIVEFPPNLLTEVSDQNFENIGAESNDIEIKIPGQNCGGDGPPIGDDEVGLIFPDVFADPGTNVCLEFTTVNFDSVETFQGSIMWDSDILSYTGVENFALSGMSAASFNTNNSANGTVSFVWFDNTGVTPASIPDDGVIFEICFDVTGSLGESSVVTAFDGNTNIQISSPAPVGIRDFVVVEGSVTIGEQVEPQLFGIKADSVIVDIVQSEVCVDFSTINFNEIASMQYTMQWDPQVLTYNRVEAVNSAFGTTFNPAGDNRLRYSWTDPQGIGFSLPDESIIYRVCFDIVGDCEDDTAISFVSEPSRPIEITDNTFNSLPDSEVMMINGRVEIACGINLNATVNNVRCNGESNGSINLMISGGATPYNVVWEWDNGNGTQTDSGVTINSLLVGQEADTYCVTVTDATGDSVDDCYEIMEPDPIVVDVTVNGSVVTINASGGNGNLEQTFSPTIDDLNNVPDGMYTITVEDNRGCMASETFSVGDVCPDPVSVDATVFSASCGGDGRIEVVCSGGSGDFTVSSDPILFFNNGAFNDVPAGTYEITCEDNQNDLCTETITVEVLMGMPDDLDITIADIQDADCTGENGSFSVNVNGGCEPYTINYSLDGGSQQNYDPNGSYSAGDYIINVEDSRGNTATSEFTLDTDASGTLSIDNVEVTASPCTGMPGQARFTVSGICGDISCSVLVNGANQQNCALVDNGDGTYTGNFPVGSHTITLTDDLTGTSDTENFSITTSPNALRATVVSAMDGAININVTGGTTPYQFFWTDPNGGDAGNSEDLSGLTITGMYSVNILDAAGCSFALTINLPGDGEFDFRVDTVDEPFDGFATPCAVGNCMGLISGNLSGGTAPYTVVLSDDNAQDLSFTFEEAGSFEIAELCAGSYTVEATDDEGDAVIIQNPVIINAPGPIVIGEDALNCPDIGQNNGSISATVSGGTGLGYVYNWSPANNDPTPGPTNENLSAGMYTLVVEDSNGCEAQRTFDLLTDCQDGDCFAGRRVITPNGDGANDLFTIRCVSNLGYSLEIYDRWGELIYSDNDYSNDWNGTHNNGDELPEGAYYWILDASNIIYRGTVTLLRN